MIASPPVLSCWRGVYHTAGDERISRFDLARRVAEVFELDQKLIKPIPSKDLEQEAKRPRDSSLNVEKIKKEVETKPFNIEQGLGEMKKQYKSTGN